MRYLERKVLNALVEFDPRTDVREKAKELLRLLDDGQTPEVFSPIIVVDERQVAQPT